MTNRSVSIGPLTVRQSPLADDALRGRYDLCLGVVSWETRAVTIFERLPPIEGRWEALSFASSDAERAAQKQTCFERMVALRSEVLTRVELASSLQYEANFQLIEGRLRSASEEMGRPLDILLDMTCMPKKYILFILGMSLRNEYVRAIDFLYAEGAYHVEEPKDSHATMSWSRSEGDWSSVQVPYLEANNFIPDARAIIVSLGAEIGSSVPFIERYEPMRIELISVEDDGARVDCDAVRDERRLLRELENLPITQVEAAPLEDVLQVTELCQAFCRGQGDMSVTGLAIGSKPHALALALAAMAEPNLEIVCRLPATYVSADVVPTGRAFIYAVEDRFEPR